jgi:hypothetical protein
LLLLKTISVLWKYISLAEFQFFAKSFALLKTGTSMIWEGAAYWHFGTTLSYFLSGR